MVGKSVLITGLASALANESDLETLRGDSLELTDLTAPDFILVDLGDAETASLLPQLCALPGVALVGLDGPSSTVTLLSGQSLAAPTLQELKAALVHLGERAAVRRESRVESRGT